MSTQRGKNILGGWMGRLVRWVVLANAAIGAIRIVLGMRRKPPSQAATPLGVHYDTVVIGSGFGGTMAGLTVARAMAARGRGERLLMLERGTWWSTPLGTVVDKVGATAKLLHERGQPVQFVNAIDHFKGLFDLVLRCMRRPGNEDGLYAMSTFGRTGALGVSSENDGVSVIGANGVGGGSLVYSNVTMAPPGFVLDDPAWPIHWNGQRDFWFELAREAIGSGVLYAWARRDGNVPASELRQLRAGSGLSTLATRTARLDPHWPLDATGAPIKRLNLTNPPIPGSADPTNALWIDRARIFQTAVSRITADYGSLDSAINDLPAEPSPYNPEESPANYCERQGRCVLGCLPDARQTLSKQLLRAILGSPSLSGQPARPPLLPDMSLQALAEVDLIQARPGGGYEIHYRQRDARNPDHFERKLVTANVVVVAAGCINTNEILLRSKASGRLPHLSEKLGYGFSTNGDSLQFLPRTREPTYLTRGTMMTSFGRFHTEESGDGPDPKRYHAIEDNGVPRVFAMLVGVGQPLVRALTKGQGRRPTVFLARTMLLWFIRHFLVGTIRAFIPNTTQYQEYFRSEDQALSNMMIVATMGRDEACGQFRLGDPASSETPLRVRRTDGKEFFEDPIYREISETLNRLAPILTGSRRARFQNPFFDLGRGTGKLLAPVPLTHPLGGCRMATSAAEGVVDEYGRVFDTSKTQDAPYYNGLYVADASIIPTSLGINPTLTISALALRVGAQVAQDHYPVPPVVASHKE